LNKKFQDFDQKFKSLENKISDKIRELDESIHNMIDSRLTKVEEDIKILEEKFTKHDNQLNILSNELTNFNTNLNSKQVVTDSILESVENEISVMMNAEILQRVHELESMAFKSDLVVNNVPVLENESLNNYFSLICQAVEFDLSTIVPPKLFRLNSGAIIMKFQTPGTKNLFFKKYLRKRNLCLRDINFESSKRIYISESASKKTRELFNIANKMKKDGWIHKAYIQNSSLFIVKKENETPIMICIREQLLTANNNPRSPLAPSSK